MGNFMTNVVTVNVLDIYLDSENPRHEPIDNQPEIIAHLCQNELVRNLGRDIAENGLSPFDNIGLIKNKSGKYIVIEGNRRVCSLILLNDPDRCHNKEQEKYFRKLSNSSSIFPSQITCPLFENREAADIWLERRHEGELGGIGTKRWTAEQKTRHSAKKGKSNDNALALALIDYGKKYNFLPQNLEGKFLTTASRFLGNPYFRQTLGIVSGRSDADVVIDVVYDEFDKVIEKFCADLIDSSPDSDVSSRTNVKGIKSYADKLIKLDFAPTKHSGKRKLSDKSDKKQGSSSTEEGGQDISGGTNGSSSAGNNQTGGSQGGSGTKHNPDKRPYLFPSSFKPSIDDKTLRRIYIEIKNINIDEKPLAVAVLARVFLENIYSMFYEKHNGYAELETHIFIERICKIIDKDTSLTKKEKNALAALRKVGSQVNNSLNPKSLGAHAHGSIYPSAIELKRGWDNISEIIGYIIKKL